MMAEDWPEETLPTSFWGKLKEELFLVYTVPRVARIHAPPLQMCYLFTFSACAFLMLGYLVSTLQLMEFNEISISNSFLQLVPPWADSQSLCYDYDYDCSDEPTKHEPSYCSRSALRDLRERIHINFFKNGTFSKARWPGGAPDIKATCRQFDAHEALEEEGKPMVMTARTMTSQTRCVNPAQEKCIWHNDGFDIDIVQNVESFFLKIRHDVMAAKVKASNSFATGFVKVKGGKRQLHCTSDGSCDENDAKMEDVDGPFCNMSECWSTMYADYLSMDLVLEAANMSLDDHIPLPSEANLQSETDLPRRYLGASLEIDIQYENVQPLALYPWPPKWYGFRKRYTYSFRKMGDYASETDIAGIGSHFTTRRLIRKTGIKVFVSFNGELGSWSSAYAVKQLAIMQARMARGLEVVFTLTMFVVNKVILNTVFRFIRHYTHLPAMKSYYAELNSPTHDQFRKAQSAKELQTRVRERDDHVFKHMRGTFGAESSSSED
eukprot:Skav208343  [mRNA]  locus=scaffold4040:19766:21486:+ [translate_table: standard]